MKTFYPKSVCVWLNKPITARLVDYRRGYHRRGGSYHQTEPRRAGTEVSFYLDSDFAPGLRWGWCDEVANSRIDHRGWWIDEYGDTETIRGVVFRLPNNRGFLVGLSMGEGMASTIKTDRVYRDELRAARAADSLAEYAAEVERTYNALMDAKHEAEDAIEEAKQAQREAREEFRRLALDLRNVALPDSLCGVMRNRLIQLRKNVFEAAERIRVARDTLATFEG